MTQAHNSEGCECSTSSSNACHPKAQQAPGRELVVYHHPGEGCDNGCQPVHRNSSGCGLPKHSLVLNTLVQSLIRLVGVNLTPTWMVLTDNWADCGTSYEVPLRYWYFWTPTSLIQATSGTGPIALWTQIDRAWSISACLACNGCLLVSRRVNRELDSPKEPPMC